MKNILLLMLLLVLPGKAIAQGTDCFPAYIVNILPSELENNIYTVELGTNVTLTASANTGNVNINSVIFQWNFNTGQFLYGQTVNYVFNQEGLFTFTISTYYNNCLTPVTFTIKVKRGDDFALYSQFNGHYDYLAIGNTLNLYENNTTILSCTTLLQSSATLNLSPTQDLVAAYLYWAGSGSGDFNVKLNNTAVTAQRTFHTTISTAPYGSNINFGAFADVTGLITGNGIYTLSDLDIIPALTANTAYCNSGINFAGWCIIIVYKDTTLPYNQVSVYDGFKTVDRQFQTLDIYLDNLNVINNVGSKIGFLAWEGDAGGFAGESLQINNVAIGNPPLNPVNNPFNGTNSFTNDATLYNMDIDFYDIQNNIAIGDTDLSVRLTSSQDAVIVNNIVVVVPSELPDATITLNTTTGQEICGNRDLVLDYSVMNLNSTGILPAGTNIAIYADTIPVGTTVTAAAIPIDGTESGTVTVTLPAAVPVTFELKLVVDDNGSGTELIREIFENNNTFTQSISLNQQIDQQTVTALSSCPVNISNQGLFDLNQAMGSVTAYDFDFYRTLGDAAGETDVITDPANFISGATTVYVRIYNPAVPSCFAIEPFALSIDQGPVLNPAGAPFYYMLCPDTGSSDTATLTVLPDMVAGVRNGSMQQISFLAANGQDMNLNNYSATYHVSQSDAHQDINPIPPGFQAVDGEVIFVRIRPNTPGGCYTVGSLQFRIRQVDAVTPRPLSVCQEAATTGLFDLSGKNGEITNNVPGLTVRYYLTEAAALLGGPDNLPDTDYSGSDLQVVYAMVEEPVIGCKTVVPLQLLLVPAPVAPDPTPLEICDRNNDGFGVFNLDPVIESIQDALGNVLVTVHETQDDAIFNTNVIAPTSAYSSINKDTQTLYIRVQSDQTVCYDLVPLTLIANPTPVAVTPSPYALCDEDGDGRAIFNLTTKAAEVLGGLSPALYNVSYFTSQADAEAGSPAILSPVLYSSPSASVYLKVTNTTTGCSTIVEQQLLVYPLPTAVQPTEPYALCDTTSPAADGIEVFDLTTVIPSITAGQQGIIVTFHHSYNDAQDNTGAIAIPTAYPSGPAVETVFVRVTTEHTGCYSIVLQDLKVEPLPIILEPTQDQLTVCDTNGQGIGEFDLEALIPYMKNGEPNLIVSFHHTSEDARDNNNPIVPTSAYVNANPYLEFVYVRVANTVTGCANWEPYQLMLIVEPAPQAPALTDLTLCDDTDNNNQDLRTVFDLSQKDQAIYDALNLDATTIRITYYINEAYARNGSPRIITPSSYLGSDGQRIWVRVESRATGCFSVTSFLLKINRPLELTTPSILAVCNEALPNDAQAVFDLTSKDDEILGPMGVGQGYVVTYYEANPRTNPGTLPIAAPQAYTNPAPPAGNPKTLFVVVTSKEGCRSYTTLTIKVLPLPLPDTTPDALVLCDDTNSPDGIEIFDLTVAESDIRNNDFQSVVTFYTTQADAEAGTNAIPDPTLHASATGSVWVRMEANTNNPADPKCFQVVELGLIVHPLPAIGDAQGNVPPYAICEHNSTGFAQFDLNSHIEKILGSNSATDYDIEFYLDQAALDAGTALPRFYTNVVVNSQTILVQVTNKATGCSVTKPLRLLAEESAVANAVTQLLAECDYEGANDGRITWDLTILEPEVLGTQNPVDYAVTYYTTLADAENFVNAIATPQAYENTPDNQTIWIRVTNMATVSKCYDVTTIALRVERLAEPVISTADGNNTICVEFGTGIVERALELQSGIVPNGHVFHWYRDGQAVADADPSTGVYLAQLEGHYTVQVTGPQPNACESEESAAFEVIRSGKASPKGKGYFVSNAFSDNQTITVVVEGYGEYEYSLDNGPRQSSNVFTNVSPGSHEVHVWDIKTGAFSCDELVLSGLSIIDYPNFFTPNGDGFNDTWNIMGLEEQTDAKIYIFDRYGKLIKQLATNGEGWDGSYNGRSLPSDDYWFSVTYKETVDGAIFVKEFKSHFAMKR